MALNPNLHIICGKCGCNHELTYDVKVETNDDTDEENFVVYILCNNCSTLSSLDEVMKEEKK